MKESQTIQYSIKSKPCYLYKAEKPSVRPSARHADNSPETAGFDSSGPQHEVLIIRLLQVCYREFMRASVALQSELKAKV